MIYFLMESTEQDRLIIDKETHPDYEILDRTEADSWIQAKKNFDFELTELQDSLLSKSSIKLPAL